MRLLTVAVSTAAIMLLPAASSRAHYDSACVAQATTTPSLINAGTIGGHGWGACENVAQGHIDHAYICAHTWIMGYVDGAWRYYPDEGARSCAQWASHVGDSGSSTRFCMDGGDRSRSYRVLVKFVAYNQDLQPVHEKWGESASRSLSC